MWILQRLPQILAAIAVLQLAIFNSWLFNWLWRWFFKKFLRKFSTAEKQTTQIIWLQTIPFLVYVSIIGFALQIALNILDWRTLSGAYRTLTYKFLRHPILTLLTVFVLGVLFTLYKKRKFAVKD